MKIDTFFKKYKTTEKRCAFMCDLAEEAFDGGDTVHVYDRVLDDTHADSIIEITINPSQSYYRYIIVDPKTMMIKLRFCIVKNLYDKTFPSDEVTRENSIDISLEFDRSKDTEDIFKVIRWLRDDLNIMYGWED